MEFEEEEVKPGIYLTRYGKKTEKKSLALTAEEYKLELEQKGLLHDDFLRGERSRFETSVRMLQETNDQLKSSPELCEIIAENLEVIKRHQGYLQVLNSLLREPSSIYL